MKKTLHVFTALLLSTFAITACGGSKDSGGNTPSGKTTPTSGGETTPGGKTTPTPAGPKKTIVYRSWDTGTETQHNEERQLIEAFEKKENCIVKVVENPGDSDYWDRIKASVVNKMDLADVMMVPNLDWPLESQFLRNIKEFTDADPEFNNVPLSVREACSFKNGVYALPARMNLQGYFVNTTVLESKLNIRADRLSCRSSYADLENIVNKAATTNEVVGLDTAAHFIDTMASVLDTTGEMGYFTWDGSEYHLNSDAFIEGVQKARSFFDAGKTLDAYDEGQREQLGLDPELSPKVDAWNKGKLVLRYGATYEIADMLENNTLNYSYKFIGNPGGKIAIVGDYYGIYKDTAEPELAYKLAKWMSFGLEGFTKRMELYAEKGSVNSLPLQNNEELIDKYFDIFGASSEMSGLEDAYTYIGSKSMVEGVKVVPGFLKARQNKKTGINIGESENVTMFELLNSCVVGGQEISTYAEQINTLANKTYSEWMEKNGGKYE